MELRRSPVTADLKSTGLPECKVHSTHTWERPRRPQKLSNILRYWKRDPTKLGDPLWTDRDRLQYTVSLSLLHRKKQQSPHILAKVPVARHFHSSSFLVSILFQNMHAFLVIYINFYFLAVSSYSMRAKKIIAISKLIVSFSRGSFLTKSLV